MDFLKRGQCLLKEDRMRLAALEKMQEAFTVNKLQYWIKKTQESNSFGYLSELEGREIAESMLCRQGS